MNHLENRGPKKAGAGLLLPNLYTPIQAPSWTIWKTGAQRRPGLDCYSQIFTHPFKHRHEPSGKQGPKEGRGWTATPKSLWSYSNTVMNQLESRGPCFRSFKEGLGRYWGPSKFVGQELETNPEGLSRVLVTVCPCLVIFVNSAMTPKKPACWTNAVYEMCLSVFVLLVSSFCLSPRLFEILCYQPLEYA